MVEPGRVELPSLNALANLTHASPALFTSAVRPATVTADASGVTGTSADCARHHTSLLMSFSRPSRRQAVNGVALRPPRGQPRRIRAERELRPHCSCSSQLPRAGRPDLPFHLLRQHLSFASMFYVANETSTACRRASIIQIETSTAPSQRAIYEKSRPEQPEPGGKGALKSVTQCHPPVGHTGQHELVAGAGFQPATSWL